VIHASDGTTAMCGWVIIQSKGELTVARRVCINTRVCDKNLRRLRSCAAVFGRSAIS
jgi:hypothetical protein